MVLSMIIHFSLMVSWNSMVSICVCVFFLLFLFLFLFYLFFFLCLCFAFVYVCYNTWNVTKKWKQQMTTVAWTVWVMSQKTKEGDIIAQVLTIVVYFFFFFFFFLWVAWLIPTGGTFFGAWKHKIHTHKYRHTTHKYTHTNMRILKYVVFICNW